MEMNDEEIKSYLEKIETLEQNIRDIQLLLFKICAKLNINSSLIKLKKE